MCPFCTHQKFHFGREGCGVKPVTGAWPHCPLPLRTAPGAMHRHSLKKHRASERGRWPVSCCSCHHGSVYPASVLERRGLDGKKPIELCAVKLEMKSAVSDVTDRAGMYLLIGSCWENGDVYKTCFYGTPCIQ